MTASYQGAARAYVFDRAAGDEVMADVSGGGLSIRATGGTFGKPVRAALYTPWLWSVA